MEGYTVRTSDFELLSIKWSDCPASLFNYNAHMNYVDKLKSSNEIDRKSKKSSHRIFFHFLDVCIVNSYVLHKQLYASSAMGMRDFRREVITSLISQTKYVK